MKSISIPALIAATALAGSAAAQAPRPQGQTAAQQHAGQQLHIQMDAVEKKIRAAMQANQIDQTAGEQALQTLMRIRADDANIRSANAGRVSDLDRGRIQQRIDDLNQQIATAQTTAQNRARNPQDAYGRSDQYGQAGRYGRGDQAGRQDQYGAANTYGRSGQYDGRDQYARTDQYGRAGGSDRYGQSSGSQYGGYGRYDQSPTGRNAGAYVERGVTGGFDPQARIDVMDRRIRDGLANGSLNRYEGRRAMSSLRSIRSLEASLLRRHGSLTSRDMATLQSRLDRLGRQIDDAG
jgi:hypothetical protein